MWQPVTLVIPPMRLVIPNRAPSPVRNLEPNRIGETLRLCVELHKTSVIRSGAASTCRDQSLTRGCSRVVENALPRVLSVRQMALIRKNTAPNDQGFNKSLVASVFRVGSHIEIFTRTGQISR